jgi:hypothetical protein
MDFFDLAKKQPIALIIHSFVKQRINEEKGRGRGWLFFEDLCHENDEFARWG